MSSKIEMQVSDRDDYDIIKAYSDYYSDRTMVCSISAMEANKIEKNYPGILEKYANKDKLESISEITKPTVVVENNKIMIENGNIEILSYLEARSLSNPEIKIVNIGKVFDMIKQGLVEPSESFNNSMSKIDSKSKVSDLFSANGKMRFRGRLWSLSDTDITIEEMEFGKFGEIIKNYRTLKNLRVIKFSPKSKTVILSKDGDTKSYSAKFFYMTPNMSSMLSEGRLVNMASERAYGNSRNQEYKLVNPIIVPDGMVINEVKKLKSPGNIPVALYNSAYDEYIYRSSIKGV